MAGKQLRTMDVRALMSLKGKIEALLAAKRSELEEQLAALSGAHNGSGRMRTVRAVTKKRKGSRAKAKAKYQSKKNKSLKWSGRGLMPVWMREEMKGTKLKKQDFAIK